MTTKILNKSNRNIYLYILTIIIIGASYSPLFMNERILDNFAREDRLLESLTPVYFFLGSILSLIAYYRSTHPPLRNTHIKFKRISYLGLALFLFVSAGEEISWGQRILGFKSPSIVDKLNYQGEFNLHNLKYFQGEESIIPFALSQVFTLIWIIFALVFPISASLNGNVDGYLRKYLPVIPISIGMIFLINYGIQKVLLRFLLANPSFYLHPSMPVPKAVHEIREHGYALAYLVSTYYIAFIDLNPARELPQKEK